VVVRHRKENLVQCSLTPLAGRPGFTFITWPNRNFRLDATGMTLLAVDAPPLSREDRGRPLLVLDSTWKLLQDLFVSVVGEPVRRSIPTGYVTAYPRRSKVYPDPSAGLASIEAIALARHIFGEDEPGLLDSYRWRDAFMAQLAKRG